MNFMRSSYGRRRFVNVRAPDGEEPGGGSPPAPPPAPPPELPPALPEWAKPFNIENADHIKAVSRFDNADAMFAALAEPDPNAWRKAMVGDDADQLKAMERFTDPKAVWKALQDSQEFIRTSRQIKAPAADATPEDIAAFSKAIGLPEKIDDFKATIGAPEGYQVTDNDKAFLGDMDKRLYAELAKDARPQSVLNAAHAIYLELAASTETRLEERADTAAAETDKTLTSEWGGEKKANLSFYEAALVQHFGAEGAEALKKVRLEDGSYLCDNLNFVKGMAAIGRSTVEDRNFLQLQGAHGADLEAEYKAALALKHTDPKRYATPEHQQKIETLIAARQRRAAAA